MAKFINVDTADVLFNRTFCISLYIAKYEMRYSVYLGKYFSKVTNGYVIKYMYNVYNALFFCFCIYCLLIVRCCVALFMSLHIYMSDFILVCSLFEIVFEYILKYYTLGLGRPHAKRFSGIHFHTTTLLLKKI